MSSGSDALDQADQELSATSGSGGLFDTMASFEARVVSIIASWVVVNVFLEPAALILGFLDWTIDSVTSSIEAILKTSLGGLSASFRDSILGPTGVIPSLQASVADLATSAGLGAPLAAGVANLALIVVTVGVVYLLGRVAAGYLSGGVLS